MLKCRSIIKLKFINIIAIIFTIAVVVVGLHPAYAFVGKGTDSYEVQVDNTGAVTGYINNQAISAQVTKGEWNEVQMVYDGSKQYIYVNGILQSSQDLSGSITTNNNSLTIGTSTVSAELDEVKIYNYARTPRQIMLDYNKSGPVAYWRFDEGYASTTYDISGYGNNGTLQSNTLWFSNGKLGKALSFDGSNDYVDVTPANSNSFNTTNLSLSVWIKTNDGSTTNKIISSLADPSFTNFRLGGANTDYSRKIVIDSFSDMIVAGNIEGTADLNGDSDTSDTSEVPSALFGSYDILLSVFNSSGTNLWYKRLGGYGSDYGRGVAVGSNIVAVTGDLNGTGDFNGDGDAADTGETTAAPYGVDDTFISVFDSSGNNLWYKRLGGSSSDSGYGAAIDSNGHVIISGTINGTGDFNGDGDTADTGETTAAPYGSYDCFISVFDSSGNNLWYKRLGGSSTDNCIDATVDHNDNIIVTGQIYGDVDLNGDGDTGDTNETQAAPYGTTDTIISAFNSSGTNIWYERLGGTGSDYGYGIAADNNNNIILSGRVNGTADLNADGDTSDTDEISASPYGGDDILISVFNSSGSNIWYKRLGGANTDYGWDADVDSDNNVIISGQINGTADLNADGDTGDTNETSASPYGVDDAFISIFDSSGNNVWYKRLGGTSTDIGYGAAADSSNNIIVTGQITGTGDLNGDADTTDGNESTASPYGNADIFISKFNSSGQSIDSFHIISLAMEDQKAIFRVYTSAMNYYTATSTNTINDSIWHFLSGVYDGNGLKLYVDGQLDDTNTNLTGNLNIISPSVDIATDYNNSSYFYGYIDDVQIYNYPRTSEEIFNYYNFSGGTSGQGTAIRIGSNRSASSTWSDGGFGGDEAVGYWRFETQGGSTAYDSSGNNNNGTITNGVWSSLGQVGGALRLNDGTISVNDNDSLDITDAITIELWIKSPEAVP